MKIIPVDINSLDYTSVFFIDNTGGRIGTIINASRVESAWFGNYFRVLVKDTDGNLRSLPEGSFHPIYGYKQKQSNQEISSSCE